MGRKKEASTRPRVYVNVGWLLRELVRVTRICTRAARRCVGIGSRAANGRVCAVGCAQRTRCAATFIRRGCSFTSYTFLSRIVRILCICKAASPARAVRIPLCATSFFQCLYFFFSFLLFIVFYSVRVLGSTNTN